MTKEQLEKMKRAQFEKNAAQQPQPIVKPGQRPYYEKDLEQFKNQKKESHDTV